LLILTFDTQKYIYNGLVKAKAANKAASAEESDMPEPESDTETSSALFAW
jgi:hypothetical protein